MNYVTLNGKTSSSIKGLLIQSLPPITKPPIRTETIQIDGMDGDITNVLGYSAYDKIVSVGLYGDYNVDEVISFFNSKGQVTFSNEPDKYYNYAVVKQIDFERLLRFKTAKITFHCQPFKYSLLQPPLVFENENLISVTNGGNTSAKPQITIYGEGLISLHLNGNLIFKINLGNENHITIDAEKLEASKDGVLKNRLVFGNYNNFTLPLGINLLLFSGIVKKIIISKYSRWI